MTKTKFAFASLLLFFAAPVLAVTPVGPPSPVSSSTGSTGGWTYSQPDSVKVNGKVGVGTSVPSYSLQISSPAGTAGTLMSVSTGGVDLFRVNGTSVSLKVPLVFPDGTVLVSTAGLGSGGGTTGPYTQNPATAPQDMGGFNIQNLASLTAASGTVTGQGFSVGGATFVVTGGNVGIGWTTPTGKLEAAGSLQHILIANNGYLGVNNLIPSYPLDVTGNARVAGALNAGAFAQGGSTNTTGVGVANSSGTTLTMNVYGTAVDTPTFRNAAVVEFSSSNFYWTYNQSVIPFLAFKSGLIGIGQSNPLAPLDVTASGAFGNMLLRPSASLPANIYWLDAANAVKLIAFASTGNNNYILGVTTGDAGLVVVSTSNKGMLGAGQSNAGGPALTWLTSGTDVRVGIGNTSPSYRLHVSTGAGMNGKLFAVSTGSVDVFSVLGGSVNLKVPLVYPDGTIQTSAVNVSPGGSNTQLQYNNGGAFAGASDVVYSAAAGVTASTITVSSLTVTGTISGTGSAGFLYTNSVGTAQFTLAGSSLVFSGSSVQTQNGTLNIGNSAGASQIQVGTSSTSVKQQGFSVGDSTFVVTGGKVGIGTTAPALPLDIVGAVQASGNMTGLSLTATSTMTIQGSGFSVGTSTLVTVGGRVGIGTTNPTSALFDIRQSSWTSGTLANSSVFLKNIGAIYNSADIVGSVYILMINTGTQTTAGGVGHLLGVVVRSSDTVNGSAYTISLEPRVDAFGEANYSPILSLAHGQHTAGTTSTLVGYDLDLQQNLMNDSTANPFGTMYGWRVRNWQGGTSTSSWVFYNNVTTAPFYNIGKMGLGNFASAPGDMLTISDTNANPTLSITGINPTMQIKLGMLSASSATYVGSTTNNRFSIYTGSVERVAVSSGTGNVGIGTTAPKATLESVGLVQISSGSLNYTLTGSTATGTGTSTLGTNCPVSGTPTPSTWIKILIDGTTKYIPAY